ncbi:MAG: hypothetical protein QOH39_2646 [Verrucomicrobiota bacterium]|jgi:hypothetical protein
MSTFADRKQLVLVGFTWLISRSLALLATRPRVPFYWEVFEIKKLFEYGFLERAGALVGIQYLPGHLSNPEVFNYVNHPYPIMWVFAFAYRFFGAWGMMLIVLSIGLASCLAVFVVFRRMFTPSSALFVTLLYTLAPSAILFDIDTNLVALGAVIWPSSMLVISHPVEQGRNSRGRAMFLGIVVFLCGQISWFILSTLPALMAITAEEDVSLPRQLRTPWKNSFWLAIVSGGLATFSLFLMQVILYSPDLSESFAYAAAHTGSQDGFLSSRIRMATFVASKTLLLVGPALVVGGLCGLVYWARGKARSRLALGAVVGLGCLLLTALVLIRFYYRERTGYAYMLFPIAVLTACVLEKTRTWLYLVLGALAIPGLAYVCLQISSPKISHAGSALAAFLQKTTKPEDVIMSNLRAQEPPFPSWDSGSREITMLAADRLLYYDIETVSQLMDQKTEFRSQRIVPRYLFLWNSSRPVSLDLMQYLERNGHLLVNQSLTIPAEEPSLALRLRSLYWRIIGSPFARNEAENQSKPGNMGFELYELPISK